MKGWRCILCGAVSETRTYAVLQIRQGSGYIFDINWNKRKVCDDCAPGAIGKTVALDIVTLREAKPKEW